MLEPCRFYFAYCEAAFDAKYIHNFQILWQKSAEPRELPTALTPRSSEELCKPLGNLMTPVQSAPSDPTTQVQFQYLSSSSINAVCSRECIVTLSESLEVCYTCMSWELLV